MKPALRTITKRAIRTATLTTTILNATILLTNPEQWKTATSSTIGLTTGYILTRIATSTETPHDQQR